MKMEASEREMWCVGIYDLENKDATGFDKILLFFTP